MTPSAWPDPTPSWAGTASRCPLRLNAPMDCLSHISNRVGIRCFRFASHRRACAGFQCGTGEIGECGPGVPYQADRKPFPFQQWNPSSTGPDSLTKRIENSSLSQVEPGFPTITKLLRNHDYFSHDFVLATAARGSGHRGTRGSLAHRHRANPGRSTGRGCREGRRRARGHVTTGYRHPRLAVAPTVSGGARDFALD
jgi:hypothetical protein